MAVVHGRRRGVDSGIPDVETDPVSLQSKRSGARDPFNVWEMIQDIKRHKVRFSTPTRT